MLTCISIMKKCQKFVYIHYEKWQNFVCRRVYSSLCDRILCLIAMKKKSQNFVVLACIFVIRWQNFMSIYKNVAEFFMLTCIFVICEYSLWIISKILLFWRVYSSWKDDRILCIFVIKKRQIFVYIHYEKAAIFFCVDVYIHHENVAKLCIYSFEKLEDFFYVYSLWKSVRIFVCWRVYSSRSDNFLYICSKKRFFFVLTYMFVMRKLQNFVFDVHVLHKVSYISVLTCIFVIGMKQ